MSQRLIKWPLYLIVLTGVVILPLISVRASQIEKEVRKSDERMDARGPDAILTSSLARLPDNWSHPEDRTNLNLSPTIMMGLKESRDFGEREVRSKLRGRVRPNHRHDRWRFLARYPRQYVVHQLLPGEKIEIDGRLDDPAWTTAAWTKGRFVNMVHQRDPKMNRVPPNFQTRAKFRWDEDFLYVGAVLHEPVIYGHIMGHNSTDGPPYLDNDFEVFIDVSGTTEYYKEFEMNVLNATYDVLWGVPAFTGLVCDNKYNSEPPIPYLPICKNSTFFSDQPGNWTMVGGSTGLQTATTYKEANYGEYVAGRSVWTLEIAFPIRGKAEHGGLLDAEGPFPASQSNYRQFDPSHGDAGPGRPRYWYFDLARAEHPRPYQLNSETIYCPLGCSDKLVGMTPNFDQLPPDQCQTVMDMWPTLLGTSTFDCYWEWVWQDLGPEISMHRPQSWAVLQFAGAKSHTSQKCRNIEFPGRHIAKQVNAAQTEYLKLKGTYTAQARQLLDPKVCWPPSCQLGDLAYALSQPEIFTVNIRVEENAKVLSPACSARPCYQAGVHVAVPRTKGYGYTVNITNNRLVTVEHHDVDGQKAPCL